MRGTIQNIVLGGFKCSLYLPPTYMEESIWAQRNGNDFESVPRYPVVYLLGEKNIVPLMDIIEEKMPDSKHRSRGCKPFILLGIETPNWEKDFSPWRATPLANRSPFTGGAPHFFEVLKTKIIPQINEKCRTDPSPTSTAIVGYSLAGLAALYALYTTGIASKVASVSGSLWYKDWVDYVSKQSIPSELENGLALYLSLGKKESQGASGMMATVDECTQKTYRALERQLLQTGHKAEDKLYFEYNDGDHFSEVPRRTAKAILFLEKE